MRRLGAALVIVIASACGSDSAAEPVRAYSIDLQVDDSGDEYRYTTNDSIDIRVGDEVTFRLDNTGHLVHDVRVVDPEGSSLAQSELAIPGGLSTVTVLFEEEGFFRLDCLVDDHLTAHGMQTFIEVTDPEA